MSTGTVALMTAPVCGSLDSVLPEQLMTILFTSSLGFAFWSKISIVNWQRYGRACDLRHLFPLPDCALTAGQLLSFASQIVSTKHSRT